MRAFGMNALVVAMTLAATVPALGQAGATCDRCTQIQREPYMAEFKITRVQTLADGTTITLETRELSALDSQGRRMNANSISMPGNMGQTELLQTRVHDPVENTEAAWNSQNKTARVTKLPPEDQRHGCWANDAGNFRANYGPIRPMNQTAAASGAIISSLGTGGADSLVTMPPPPPPPPPLPPGSTVVSSVAMPSAPVTRSSMPRPVHEDLGTDVIQGVEVRGTRITQTIPVGQIGNDRPIVSTTENWMAPSLGGIVLRSVQDSPQTGRQTREVVSLAIGDPDPSLFQPPEGYKVTVDVLHEVPCQQNQP
jgi:hypothetical protein